MAKNVWVSETTASRLIGLDAALISKRAHKGKYGPTRPGAKPKEILVTTRGLEMAARRSITSTQIAAAEAGQPLPTAFGEGPGAIIHRQPRYTIDEIGADVVRREMEN
jgi:hypothetical protein